MVVAPTPSPHAASAHVTSPMSEMRARVDPHATPPAPPPRREIGAAAASRRGGERTEELPCFGVGAAMRPLTCAASPASALCRGSLAVIALRADGESTSALALCMRCTMQRCSRARGGSAQRTCSGRTYHLIGLDGVREAATVGRQLAAGSCPSHRARAYIVIWDLPPL